MPIDCQFPLQPLNREEFGRLSYSVLNDIFALHNELGRYFEESIYQRALAAMRNDIQLEVWIDVTHGDFHKRYFLDAVAQTGGIIELKSVDKLAPRHQAQLLHYLMLTDQQHGLLVNLRPTSVEHTYVNNAIPRAERLRFHVEDVGWQAELTSAKRFREVLLAILSDWGTGLELALYEEALIHFLGGPESVEQRVAVAWQATTIGTQLARLAAPRIAFKLTAFENAEAHVRFIDHTRRLLKHVALDAILWANVGRHSVTFTTLTAETLGQKDR